MSPSYRSSWGILALLLLSVVPAQARGRQELPVTLEADPVSHELRWSDPGGRLDGEVAWVLRSDLRGPETWLLVERRAGGAPQCAEEVRFRVLAGGRIEYRVEVTSDLAGALSWTVRHGEKRTIRLRSCIPRPSEDRRACLWGGIPRPLLQPLEGTIEARLEGSEPFVPVEVVRFATAPQCDRSPTDRPPVPDDTETQPPRASSQTDVTSRNAV